MGRLLPAALVVVTATAAASVLVLSVVRRIPLVCDAQSSLLYYSNWHFLSQSNDYFAADGVDPVLAHLVAHRVRVIDGRRKVRLVFVDHPEDAHVG